MVDYRRRRLCAETLEHRLLPAAVGPQVIDNTMHVVGTAGDDAFAYVAHTQSPVLVNGVGYAIPTGIERIVFDGAGGRDALTATSTGNTALWPGRVEFTSGPHGIGANGIASIRIYATGNQAVRLYDSLGTDTFVDRSNYARMFGADYDNVAIGFNTVIASSSADPGDVGWFYNLPGAHVYSGRESSSRSFNSSHQATAFGFLKVYAWSADGEGDVAELHGGVGDDQFIGKPDESRLWGTGFHYVALAFDRVVGRGGLAGMDRAHLYDSASDDRLAAWPTFTRLEGPGFNVEANAFDLVHAHADAGGRDTATLYDGDGHDQFNSTPTTSSIEGNGIRTVASHFDLVVSRSTHGGADEAEFQDSAGPDDFTWADDIARLNGAGFDNRAIGFDRVEVRANQGGYDRAWLRAKSGDERYTASKNAGQLFGANRSLLHDGIEDVQVAWPKRRQFTPELSSLEFALNSVELADANNLPLGSGVLHPWKIVPDKYDSRNVLVVTGQGEAGGNSFLYRMDATTLKPIGAPLKVGVSASDIVWVGDYVIATARGSSELVLVDPAAWQVLDRMTVFAEPMAAAAIANDRFIIASIQAKELRQFAIRGARLVLEKRIAIPGTAYDLTFDASTNRVFVNHPSLHAVSEINVVDGVLVRKYAVGGEPSYSGVIFGRFYIATNRDGYLHFIDRVTQSIYVIDLAVALNLDRAQLAMRGIEPMDIVVWDESHFAVVNSRQDSLLYSFNPQSAFSPPVYVERFTGAVFGTKLPSANEMLLTSPTVNRIDRVTISLGLAKPSISLQTNIVGVAPVAAARLGSGAGATLAVVTSDHRLHFVNEFTHEIASISAFGAYKVSAWHPMTADENGRLWLVVNKPAGPRLIALSASGTLLFDFECALERPFSLNAQHDSVVAVDRTNQQVQYVDVLSGASQTIRLANQRPRYAEILARDESVLIHDTNPDIGVSHYLQGRLSFHPYAGGRWLAGLAQDGSGRVLVLDYNGSLHEFVVNQAAFRSIATLPSQPMTELRFGQGSLWAASPTTSSVFLLRREQSEIEMAWSGVPAFDVLPSDGGAWFVADTGLHWHPRYSDANWWK